MLDHVCDWIEGHYLRATYYILAALAVLFTLGIYVGARP